MSDPGPTGPLAGPGGKLGWTLAPNTPTQEAGPSPSSRPPVCEFSPREPGFFPVLQLQQPLILGRTAFGLGFLGPHLLGARREPPRACGTVSQNGPLPPGPRGLGTQLPDSSTETSPAWEPYRLCVPMWSWLGVSRPSAEPWTKHFSPKTGWRTELYDGAPGGLPCPHCQHSRGTVSPAPPSIPDQAGCYLTSKPWPSPA